MPSKAEEVAGMLQEGRVQGFHVDYFPKGHGPTDFDRWAAAALEENAEGAEPCTPRTDQITQIDQIDHDLQ